MKKRLGPLAYSFLTFECELLSVAGIILEPFLNWRRKNAPYRQDEVSCSLSLFSSRLYTATGLVTIHPLLHIYF